VCGVRKPFTRMDYNAKRVEQKQWRATATQMSGVPKHPFWCKPMKP